LGGQALALAEFDDGSGDGVSLFVGGGFFTAGGVNVNRIAKWNGTDWSALGSGASGLIRTLTTFDDGEGEALYAGGSATTMGGVDVNHVGKWDGTQWTA